VPAIQRGTVVVGWYNDPLTSPYDHAFFGEPAYDNLRSYTVEANTAPGGGSPPTTGWVTLATVTNNTYHSREHVVDMTGNNWIRLNVTAIDGSAGNNNAMVNMDVHDARLGVRDSWIFYGDSIAQDGLAHSPLIGAGQNFSQYVNAANSSYFPAFENGGIGGTGAADGASHVNSWLPAFPGRYVGLAFGTNDANGCGNVDTFYADYVTMVQAVLAAGKVPVVPTIPWARTANVQNCGPGFVAKIQQLYTAFPQIVRGPDLWTFFMTHQNLISSDNLHPSDPGYEAYRQQWADAMTANVYEDDRQRCLDAGMNTHLAKPIDPKALEQLLRDWLGPAHTD
jgi:lysophospholipase L1-like esterase